MRLLHRANVFSDLVLSIDKMSSGNKHPANSKEWEADINSAVIAETEYAILSHRWDTKDELTFQDLVKVQEISVGGFKKACKQSAGMQLSSAGMYNLSRDLSTDISAEQPRNGAELLEALAQFCSQLSATEKRRLAGLVKLVEFCVIAVQQKCKYAWMDTCCIDKSRSAELEESIRSMFRWFRNAKICIVHLADTHSSVYHMRRDPWFTRGWTLQELLAPKGIKFFDADWFPLTNNRR